MSLPLQVVQKGPVFFKPSIAPNLALFHAAFLGLLKINPTFPPFTNFSTPSVDQVVNT